MYCFDAQQYCTADDPPQACRIARMMVFGKIYNARWSIERTCRDHAMRAGARIEICSRCSITRPSDVAPFTGAWIEIIRLLYSTEKMLVAPFVGARIEISWML